MKADELRVPALQVRQGPSREFYTFAVDGKLLHRIAAVSRVKRGSAGDLAGYQRPEVLSHIAEIRGYLESPEPMIPNALVVAFDERVRFEPASSDAPTAFVRGGTLVIPLAPAAGPHEPFACVGWIVDGQQRAAAIRDARLESFPIAVSGFIAPDERHQREQFILVNSTKPLPKGLLYELLPETGARLSSHLQRRRYPAQLLARLNGDVDSPFYQLIATPTTPEGVVKDNSILRMIENSLSDGALYAIERVADDENERAVAQKHTTFLKAYWKAVAQVFREAWGLPPRRSRLMHGAGIVALGFVMDAIAARHADRPLLTAAEFEEDLFPLRQICRWTDGYWEFGPGMQRKWSELQNTSKDVGMVANYLLHQYKRLVWDKSNL